MDTTASRISDSEIFPSPSMSSTLSALAALVGGRNHSRSWTEIWSLHSSSYLWCMRTRQVAQLDRLIFAWHSAVLEFIGHDNTQYLPYHVKSIARLTVQIYTPSKYETDQSA